MQYRNWVLHNLGLGTVVLAAETGVVSEALRVLAQSDVAASQRKEIRIVSVIMKASIAQAGPLHKSNPQVVETVTAVLDEIRADGDSAVRKYSEQFDRWTPESFRLSDAEVAKIVSDLPTTVIDDLSFVQRQVRNFAKAQRDSMLDVEIESLPGVRLGHKHVPVSASGRTCLAVVIRSRPRPT